VDGIQTIVVVPSLPANRPVAARSARSAAAKPNFSQ